MGKNYTKYIDCNTKMCKIKLIETELIGYAKETILCILLWHIQQLIEVHPSEGELPEGPLLLLSFICL